MHHVHQVVKGGATSDVASAVSIREGEVHVQLKRGGQHGDSYVYTAPGVNSNRRLVFSVRVLFVKKGQIGDGSDDGPSKTQANKDLREEEEKRREADKKRQQEGLPAPKAGLCPTSAIRKYLTWENKDGGYI